jgi:hypothetical protein
VGLLGMPKVRGNRMALWTAAFAHGENDAELVT